MWECQSVKIALAQGVTPTHQSRNSLQWGDSSQLSQLLGHDHAPYKLTKSISRPSGSWVHLEDLEGFGQSQVMSHPATKTKWTGLEQMIQTRNKTKHSSSTPQVPWNRKEKLLPDLSCVGESFYLKNPTNCQSSIFAGQTGTHYWEMQLSTSSSWGTCGGPYVITHFLSSVWSAVILHFTSLRGYQTN